MPSRDRDTSNIVVRQRQRVPKSCLACLGSKRACSMDKPSCMRCAQRKQECVYRTQPLDKPRQSGSGGKRRKIGEQHHHEQDLAPLPEQSEASTSSHRPSRSPQQGPPPDPDADQEAVKVDCFSSWSVTGDPLLNSPCHDSPVCSGEKTQAHIQSALTGLLNPVHEVFFQYTGLSTPSIPEFTTQALQLLPPPKEAASYIEKFRLFLRPALPALYEDGFLAPAEGLLVESRQEERSAITLPWLAVSLMITAIGQQQTLDGNSNIHHPNSGSGAGSWFATSAASSSKPESDALLFAAHQALRLVSFHSSPTLQTIYCQLLMGLYLIQTERISTFWPILGSIARQAQAIGLHVEPRRAMPDQQLRRQIWWAIVQQDVLLSSVFRLPLAVSSFSCQPADPDSSTEVSGCVLAQAQFAMLERRHLMGNMDQEWDRMQLNGFRGDLIGWYLGKPEPYRVTLDDQCRIKGDDIERKMRGKTMAGIETILDHFVELHYTLLTLYRNRLQDRDAALREESYTICGNVIHNIVTSFGVMVDMLGILQVGSVWLRLFYVFHAGVNAAYLAVARAASPLGKQARADLIKLTALCQRLPQRYKGLQTINSTFTLLLEQVEVHNRQSSSINSHAFSSACSVDANSCQSAFITPTTTTTTTSAGTKTHNNEQLPPLQAPGNDIFAPFLFSEESWTGDLTGPFGPTDLLPGPQASGEDILAFWNNFFTQRQGTDDLQFG